jgi:hypothetical protein
MYSCKAGDGTAGRRLTCSDARVGYRISGFRPGLVPVLQRASARGWPPSGAREFPTVSRPQPCTTVVFFAGVNPFTDPWRQERRCYVLCSTADAGSTSRAIAHRKAAISRAIAVITTVLRFPFAVRRR